MEAQLQGLVAAVNQLQQQLAAGDAARVTLEAEVLRLQGAPAAGAGGGGGQGPTRRDRVGIDTRNLGRPSSFNGSDDRWRDWAVVFRSYAALVNPALQHEMLAAETEATPVLNSSLLGDDEVQASTELYHLLLHSCTQTALDRVVNAGPSEGLRAWQLLVERFDPRLRSRAAGQLLGLLQYDFSGDALAKIEAFERQLSLYEQSAGEQVSESLRIGIVLNRIQDNELATHLLLNAERLKTWPAFRKELVDVARARAAAGGAYQTRPGSHARSSGGVAPMDVDGLMKGGGKETRMCHNCGKPGHIARDCWSPTWPGGGGQGGGQGGGLRLRPPVRG